MATTITVTIAELDAQFKAKYDAKFEAMELRAKVNELEAKLAAMGTDSKNSKKSKKPKDPNAPVKPKKSKYANPEELALARRENGLRLAAANKLKRDAKKEAEKLDAEWLASEQAQKSETSSESGDNAASESGSEQ